VIPAGGSGQLTAKIKINPGSSGSHAKNVTVTTDAAGAPVLRLTLAYTAVNPISASPRFRLYLNTVEGESESSRVLLHRTDGEALEAKIVEVTPNDRVTVSLEPVAATEDRGSNRGTPGDVWVVAATREGVRTGNANGMVSLTTNDPRVPKLEIPLYLRVRPVLEVRPQSITLWPAAGGPGGMTAKIRLSHSSRQPFEVTGVEVSHPELLAARVASSAGQPIQAIAVNLSDDAAVGEGPIRGWIRLATSVPGKELVEVPVVITEQHEALKRSRRPLPSRSSSAGAGAPGTN
jgi:hypothetical protein